jgi:hypothetical protein
MNAKELLNYLLELDKVYDLSKVNLCYRDDRDSDVEIIQHVEEDLYDADTNSILESIMFLNNPNDI